MEAGLPNITGHATVNMCTTSTDSGALYKTTDSSGVSIKTPTWGNSYHKPLIHIDASKCSIYGNSNTVTPISLTTLLLIKY